MTTPVPKTGEKQEKPVKQTPATLMNTTTMDGVKYLAGVGPVPADVMIIGQNPTTRESERSEPFSDKYASKLKHALAKAGIDWTKCRLTYAVKYATYMDKQPKSSDQSSCRAMLEDEIARVNPRLIIAMGMPAFQAAMGTGYKMTQFQGVFVESNRYPGRTVLAIWHPGYILRNPQMEYQFDFNLGQAARWMQGVHVESPEIKYAVIASTDEFSSLLDRLESRKSELDYLIVDCEWEGANPTSPGAYLRTLQINVAVGETYVVRFFPEPVNAGGKVDPDLLYPSCASVGACMFLFKDFLVRTGVQLAGHNAVSDGRWMLHNGCDIRDHVFFDSMLAEHLIDNTQKFSLSDLCLKYTSYGVYEAELARWKKTNEDLMGGGYGAIPEAILFPYAAIDVECIRPIISAQLPLMAPYMKARGHKAEYMSLFDSVMVAQRDLYELEEFGLPVDPVRLKDLTVAYHAKLRELEAQFTTAVTKRGWNQGFNHRSTGQVADLLYGSPDDPEGNMGGLGLIPIVTTGKPAKQWEWVMKQPQEVQEHFSPSTDKNTLEILSDRHPIVRMLLNIRKVDQMCKNFLREDEAGGIPGCLFPDGRLHPEFNQLTDSGRLSTRKPNCQNFSKAAERFFKEIFGAACPEALRTVVVPPEGWLFVEADFIQAELFVLAGIAGDDVMMGALTTPGKDLHDLTAISAFRLAVMLDGQRVQEQWLLDLALKNPDEFARVQKKLTYLDTRGRLLTRDEFKNGVRVSAKAVNFGIPYGRGSSAISFQIRAETGQDVPVQEIQDGIDAWKRTYNRAWDYMEQCQRAVLNPGYVETPWGRRRYFPRVKDELQIRAYQRESQNHPIQSTVADTMRLAMAAVRYERDQRNLRFRICNQIHDALLIAAPVEEVETAKDILRRRMGNVPIPLADGTYLTLGTDIEVYSRWGEKLKH